MLADLVVSDVTTVSLPWLAMDFYRAIAADDHATTNRLLDGFFLPYLQIRNRKAGYAVSIVKAGARLVGTMPARSAPR